MSKVVNQMGASMSVITSVETFLDAIRTYTAMQTGQCLESRISWWLAYHRCLLRTLERYRDIHTTYMHARQRYRHQRVGREHGVSHRTIVVRHELAAIHDLYSELQCEGESFYTLAIGVLDSIADTFQCYFGLSWDRSAATHARLSRHFHFLCAEKDLVLTPTALRLLMPDVHACIAESRARLTSMTDVGCLMTCLSKIDAYSAAMLQFFAMNGEKSVLAGLWLLADAPSALTAHAAHTRLDDPHVFSAPVHPVLS